MKSFGAVIISYNPDISVLVSSVQQLILAEGYVVIVDNCSINSEQLNALGAVSLEIIFLEKNLGIAEAQNVGLRKLILLGYTEFITLDQDSIISKQDIINLFHIRDKFKSGGLNIGIVAPNIPEVTRFPINDQIACAQQFEENVYETSIFQSSGSCFDIDVLLTAGFLEAELFIDFVDYEWNFRVADSGFRNFVLVNVGMQHTFGKSGLNNGSKHYVVHHPIRRFYASRNALLLINRKYIPLRWRLSFCLTPFRAIYADILNKNLSSKTLAAILKGVFFGVKGLIFYKKV